MNPMGKFTSNFTCCQVFHHLMNQMFQEKLSSVPLVNADKLWMSKRQIGTSVAEKNCSI